MDKQKIFGWLVLITVIVALTKSYVVFAAALRTSVGVITSIFFLLNVFLIHRHINVIRTRGIFVFTMFLILIPLLITLINLDFSITALILQLFYFTQVLIGAIAINKYRNQLSRAVVLATLINFIVGVVSMFKPELFIVFSEIATARFFYGGRAIAFFLQPNALGLASVLIFILCKFICSEKQKQVLFPIILLTTIITGSRSAIIALTLLLVVSFILKIIKGELNLFRGISRFFKYSIIVSILLITFFNTKYAAIVFDSGDYDQLTQRFDFFLELNDNSLEEDGSVSERLYYQQKYTKELPNFILKGNGIGTQGAAIEKGELAGSAHQAYLELLYQGGIFYLLSFILIFILLLNIIRKNKKISPLRSDFALYLFCFVFLVSFVSTGILSMRELFLAFGIMLLYEKRPVKVRKIKLETK